MGISVTDSKLVELARLISEWPGLVSGPAAQLIDDSLVLLENLGKASRLVEADQAKAAFLVRACAALGLRDVEVLAKRAEEVGQDPLYRESFDVAVARALAPMPVLAELCLPLVKVGGRLLAQKTASEHLIGAAHAIDAGGGALNRVVAAPSAARRAGTVVIVDKVRTTPQAYPRRPGVPARKPL